MMTLDSCHPHRTRSMKQKSGTLRGGQACTAWLLSSLGLPHMPAPGQSSSLRDAFFCGPALLRKAAPERRTRHSGAQQPDDVHCSTPAAPSPQQISRSPSPG
eukprot:361326-Chlamydomonas_euryale.AAC.7